jgi:hypothetical protein
MEPCPKPVLDQVRAGPGETERRWPACGQHLPGTAIVYDDHVGVSLAAVRRRWSVAQPASHPLGDTKPETRYLATLYYSRLTAGAQVAHSSPCRKTLRSGRGMQPPAGQLQVRFPGQSASLLRHLLPTVASSEAPAGDRQCSAPHRRRYRKWAGSAGRRVDRWWDSCCWWH